MGCLRNELCFCFHFLHMCSCYCSLLGYMPCWSPSSLRNYKSIEGEVVDVFSLNDLLSCESRVPSVPWVGISYMCISYVLTVMVSVFWCWWRLGYYPCTWFLLSSGFLLDWIHISDCHLLEWYIWTLDWIHISIVIYWNVTYELFICIALSNTKKVLSRDTL